MRNFEIHTCPDSGGMLIFLTKANNGKEALRSLINHSSDFKHILGKAESYNMVIGISSGKVAAKAVENYPRRGVGSEVTTSTARKSLLKRKGNVKWEGLVDE